MSTKTTSTAAPEQPHATAVVLSRPAALLPVSGMNDIAAAGNLLAQANFLGTRNAGEGFVVMATCQQMGISLVDFQQKYHFRQGRFSIQAHALLAEFVDRGGSYKVLERSATRAALELTKDGNTYTSEITWEQALAEPFVYAGNETEQLAALDKPQEKRHLKAKYRTPRSRMQMLWARAVSDGVVVVDPGARGGIYTTEETEDFAPALPPASEPVPVTIDAARVAAAAGPSAPVGAAPAAAVQSAASASVAAAAPAAAAPAEPSPFDTPTPDATALCPIPGKLLGQPWEAMETEVLKLALTIECPEMTTAHRDAVLNLITRRNGGNGRN